MSRRTVLDHSRIHQDPRLRAYAHEDRRLLDHSDTLSEQRYRSVDTSIIPRELQVLHMGNARRAELALNERHAGLMERNPLTQHTSRMRKRGWPFNSLM